MSTATEHGNEPAHGHAPPGEYEGPAITTQPHGGHPSDLQYIYIAVFLGVVTAIEVWLSYIGGIDRVRPYLLIGAGIIKFFFVVAYFMHLKFDSKNFRRLFLVGIFLALFCYLVLMFLMGSLYFGSR